MKCCEAITLDDVRFEVTRAYLSKAEVIELRKRMACSCRSVDGEPFGLGEVLLRLEAKWPDNGAKRDVVSAVVERCVDAARRAGIFEESHENES
jgi:hypothetical protein